MKNINKNFITTFDEVVAKKLKADGYTLLSDNNGRYMFINNGVLKFDAEEDITETVNKMHYTNLLCMV